MSRDKFRSGLVSLGWVGLGWAGYENLSKNSKNRQFIVFVSTHEKGSKKQKEKRLWEKPLLEQRKVFWRQNLKFGSIV